MTAPRLVNERVATNGEYHLLERIYHHGPDMLRVRVVRNLHSATRSRAVTERLTANHSSWAVLAEVPAHDWYDATSGCTLATTARVLGRVAGTVLGQAVREHPTGTVFGERYDDTAALELPQLAIWLTAEVTTLLRAHSDPAWRAVRCATVARPASRGIQLNLYGLSEPAERWEPDIDDQRVLDDLRRLADHHNWHRGHEHRFILILHVVADHSAPTLLARGEAPGTITVES
ncbi:MULTISPECIES: hypothetical protein [Amycolatopsis]|uniref:Uncharacterized protein n=2 Tax=Amycolatopsis TaxID=1813 RepID=A0A2N3WF21_9PSEU|nr:MULTISPECIES: hypothetical protein [Amycolatopsis]MBB2505965.1 hypothetical protein [Amycolatopsis echigonensis]PKV92447.1 hypothetical protein ATK30_3251 [Amycolatopsis niigatensis]TVT16776.1 hypothetical protein FNH06_34065 [Amycolatopsis acidiphila]UIJ59633.1 hypothetical protein LWP59_37385 [Amycolatopsis acidiphila]GHG81016.1 hypothetical protein GCM10017788_50580 [Amycolatopsis acidiphila]